jgi:hypothetical protein
VRRNEVRQDGGIINAIARHHGAVSVTTHPLLGVAIIRSLSHYLIFHLSFFPFDDSGIDIAGSNVVVKERHNNANEVEDGGTGLNVWDGSLLLARYLECRPELVRDKAVIELGAGCEFVALCILFDDLGILHVIFDDLGIIEPTQSVYLLQHH